MSGDAVPLRLEGARIRGHNGVLAGPYDLSTNATRVGLLGDFGALFRFLDGRAELEGGRATLLGSPCREALASGAAAVVPLDPPLPPVWTCERYLSESASLLGDKRAAARERARAALERFELGSFARRTLGSLAVHDKRVLGLVRATLADPKLLLCEAPLSGAAPSAQRLLAMALERASAERALVLCFHGLPRVGLERALFESCGEHFVMEAGGVRRAELAALDACTLMSVLVAENVDAFERELAARELAPTRLGQVDLAYAFLYANSETHCVRFSVQAPDANARRKVLEASLAASAPLLELRPL